MELSHALIVLLCFSLDGFVVMLKKGASLRELPIRSGLVYSAIFSLVNTGALAAGYLFALLFREFMSRRVEVLTAILIVFALGVFFTTRAIHSHWEEERLDRNFNEMNCLRLALRCAGGTVLIGIGCFLIGLPFLPVLLMTAGITFVFILLALYLGYNLGSPMARTVSILNGILMMLFSFYLLSVYVIGPRF